MGLINRLSLRNLMRQKRRNLFLGAAIAFGMSILIVANAFSHGISDTLFNKMIVFIAGHMEIDIIENGRFRTPVMRDRAKYVALITSNVSGLVEINDSLSTMCRGIGNGKSNLMVIEFNPEHPQADEYRQLSQKIANNKMFVIPKPLEIDELEALLIEYGIAN